jgi:hypothetical protein
MINDTTAALLLDYLDGKLAGKEREQLEIQLANDAALHSMLEEIRQSLQTFEGMPEQQPSAALDQHFNTFLLAEKNHLQSPNWPGRARPFLTFQKREWQLGAAAALLLIGFGFAWFWKVNQQQQAEILALHQEMRSTQKMLLLAMLEKPSASDRIQAVNVLEQQKVGPEVIKALIYTFNFDDMVNVRMKAAQALGTFGHDETAKTALIDGLKNQESPEVQIIIIEILSALGDKRAVAPLRALMDNPNLMEIVRSKAAESVGSLL